MGYHLAWVRDHPNWARYPFQIRGADFMASSEGRIAEHNRTFVARFKEWLRPHVRSGAARRLPPDVSIAVLLGPSREYARRWLAGKTTTGLDEAADDLAEAAWRSLRGDDPAARAPPQATSRTSCASGAAGVSTSAFAAAARATLEAEIVDRDEAKQLWQLA